LLAASPTEHAPGVTETSVSPAAQPHDEPMHSSGVQTPAAVLHWLPMGACPQPASVAASPVVASLVAASPVVASLVAASPVVASLVAASPVAASLTEHAPGTTATSVWPDAQPHEEPMHAMGVQVPAEVLHWLPMGFVPQVDASDEGVLDDEQAARTRREAKRIDFMEGGLSEKEGGPKTSGPRDAEQAAR
jgi:hypothetical protein